MGDTSTGNSEQPSTDKRAQLLLALGALATLSRKTGRLHTARSHHLWTWDVHCAQHIGCSFRGKTHDPALRSQRRAQLNCGRTVHDEGAPYQRRPAPFALHAQLSHVVNHRERLLLHWLALASRSDAQSRQLMVGGGTRPSPRRAGARQHGSVDAQATHDTREQPPTARTRARTDES
eukprot:2078239-Pleurochrysis_carterae.AAC.1